MRASPTRNNGATRHRPRARAHEHACGGRLALSAELGEQKPDPMKPGLATRATDEARVTHRGLALMRARRAPVVTYLLPYPAAGRPEFIEVV
jgi:hypothetical protein